MRKVPTSRFLRWRLAFVAGLAWDTGFSSNHHLPMGTGFSLSEHWQHWHGTDGSGKFYTKPSTVLLLACWKHERENIAAGAYPACKDAWHLPVCTRWGMGVCHRR